MITQKTGAEAHYVNLISDAQWNELNEHLKYLKSYIQTAPKAQILATYESAFEGCLDWSMNAESDFEKILSNPLLHKNLEEYDDDNFIRDIEKLKDAIISLLPVSLTMPEGVERWRLKEDEVQELNFAPPSQFAKTLDAVRYWYFNNLTNLNRK